MTQPETPWESGRFDGRRGPGRVLFGRMYEDAGVERAAFRPGGRIFCIASAGCTALALAPDHEVVAADINPAQLAYAERRIGGAPCETGDADRLTDFARRFAPLVGWRRGRLRAFLDLEEPAEQLAVWRRQLDTRRFRAAFGALLSPAALRRVYSAPFLRALPRNPGSVFRQRMARCFASHANRSNPYARALLLGAGTPSWEPAASGRIRLVLGDAATVLEAEPAGSFDGFTLSNILDAAEEGYGEKLRAAIRRAAAPGATVILRSFREPEGSQAFNRAADDRSMLWGIVDVRPVEDL